LLLFFPSGTLCAAIIGTGRKGRDISERLSMLERWRKERKLPLEQTRGFEVVERAARQLRELAATSSGGWSIKIKVT